MTLDEIKRARWDIRKLCVDIIMKARGGHIGGDMSVLDILALLYLKRMNISMDKLDDPLRDRFILSKGHSVEALYAVLCAAGILDKEELLESIGTFNTPYIGHPTTKIPGIEMNTGSLGHGLSLGVGMAKASKMNPEQFDVFVVMGDGELAEGSVWEAAMAATQYKLDNLVAFVDRNRLQISGSTEDVMHQDSQLERWKAFGWHVLECAGNNIDALDAALDEAKATKGKPTVIIANTTKGYGSPLMEKKAGWHHHLPNQDEYQQIIKDFEAMRMKEEAHV